MARTRLHEENRSLGRSQHAAAELLLMVAIGPDGVAMALPYAD
jgi:hypothetical protein